MVIWLKGYGLFLGDELDQRLRLTDIVFIFAKILNLKTISKIFTPFFKSNIFGVKMKNLKKSFISHLIIYIKLAYIQIWSQSVILDNDLCQPSVYCYRVLPKGTNIT